MSAYLQRLFDRGAGLAAAAPAAAAGPVEVTPAMASGSPVVAFDQRLAEPGWALGFGMPAGQGVPAQAPEAAGLEDPGPWPGGVPLPQQPAMLAASAPVAGPGLPSEASPGSRPVARPAGPALERPVPERAERPRRETPGERRPQRPFAAAVAVDPAAPVIPLAAIHPVAQEHPQAALPSAALAAPQARESLPRGDAREPRQAGAAPLRWEAATFAAQPDMPVLRGEPGVTLKTGVQPGGMEAPEHPRRLPAGALQAPGVEPLRPAPAPLAPLPAAGPDLREVQRLVREAVRTELARRPAPAAQAAPAGPQEARQGRDTPAAPRPASAREASVIGELEPSASPLTIHGLRRR